MSLHYQQIRRTFTTGMVLGMKCLDLLITTAAVVLCCAGMIFAIPLVMILWLKNREKVKDTFSEAANIRRYSNTGPGAVVVSPKTDRSSAY